MKMYKSSLIFALLFGVSAPALAEVEDLIEEQILQASPWEVNTNVFFEVEDFRGYKIDGNRVYDKLSPAFQLAVNPPDSKWSYFLEYKVSMRNYTTGFSARDTSYERNRLQLQGNRKLYQGDKAKLNLSLVYRKESNDVRTGQPAKNSYHSYWLIPAGSYNFNDQFAFAFWDAVYYYDNAFSGTGYNRWEWESEHGFQYKFSDDFLGKLMFYTDRTWNSDGDKTWEQNQIRGYFPTTINQTWSVQPYFRFFINEKNYNPANGNVTNRVDLGGLRLGFILNYKLNPKTTLWTNLAWERIEWDKSKNSSKVRITHGDNNLQDFRLYSVGIRHSW